MNIVQIWSKGRIFHACFSYEGFEGHGRIGKLESVRENAKIIAVNYQLYDAFPPIPIFDETTYSRFGCSGWECNRTHWAVKNIDLYKVAAEIYGEKVLDSIRLPINDLDRTRIWGDGNANCPRLFISHKAAHRGKVEKLAETLNTPDCCINSRNMYVKRRRSVLREHVGALFRDDRCCSWRGSICRLGESCARRTG